MANSARRKRPASGSIASGGDVRNDSGDVSISTSASDATARSSTPAPTLPFKYFSLAIERLKAAGNVPHRIDRSAWSTKQFRASGALIVPTFQFLQLIDVEGRPLHALGALITSFGTDSWRDQLARTLRAAYSDTLALGIEKLTPKDILDLFKQRYDLDAVRGRMAVSFFVHATREADLDVGPFMSATTKPPPQHPRMTVEKHRTIMLSRLPPFEDSWSEELKLAWFTAFKELVSPSK